MLRHASQGQIPDQHLSREEPDRDPLHAPLWLEHLVFAGCCTVLFVGGFGLLLAVVGQFSGPRALLLGAIGTVAGIAVGRPRQLAAQPARIGSTTLPAVAMLAIAAGIAVWNAKFEGYHVAVDSDPGVYAVTGRWLADHGSLVVPAGAPWTSTGLQLSFGSAAGMYLHAGATLQFQFAHFWPTLLAEAYSIGGGTLMFRTPAIVGAIALLAIYLVGCRVIRRPWLVVVAVTALGISLPELAVSRDTLSETSTQLLLWFGIWLLIRSYEERRFLVSVVAGLAVGGTLMTHIDALIYLAPLPPLGALAWVAARSSTDRRSVLRVLAGVVLGALPAALLGTIDIQRRAGRYYSDLRPRVVSLYLALAFATIAAALLVVLWPRLRPLRALLSMRRHSLGVVAGWTVVLVVLLAWSLRPAGPKTFGPPNQFIKELQEGENLPIQPGRTYSEMSMRWIGWYVGPIGLASAIAGVGLLTVRAISRGSARWIILLALTGPVTALYLWNPEVNPFQIWATRRFVPAALPLFLLAAGVLLDTAASECSRRLFPPAWPRRILLAGAAGLIAFPLGASLPLRSFQPQANSLAMIDRVCHTIGPDAAVLFPAKDFEGIILTQVIRSWCKVPAAQLTSDLDRPQLSGAEAALRADGRTLWVLGSNANSITTAAPGLTSHLVALAANNRQVQPSLQAAATYGSDAIAVWGASDGP